METLTGIDLVCRASESGGPRQFKCEIWLLLNASYDIVKAVRAREFHSRRHVEPTRDAAWCQGNLRGINLAGKIAVRSVCCSVRVRVAQRSLLTCV